LHVLIGLLYLLGIPAVPHDFAFNHENNQLGYVDGMVGDALEIF
jgi:hypothetical protein